MKHILRDLILDEPKISKYLNKKSIYAYRVPTDAEKQKDIIVMIEFLDVPTPYTYFDGEYHHEEYLVQIDVFAPNKKYKEYLKVSGYIQDLIEQKLNWKLQGGIDQYDKELKVFRMAKRYRGIYKILRERL